LPVNTVAWRSSRTRGGDEPEWVRLARAAYWAPYQRWERLVTRICRTDAGMEFHFRCQAIGYADADYADRELGDD
jgi:hypothetical protein